MLSKALLIILVNVLIQPLKGKTETKRKASKMVFNVWDPSLWAGIWVYANEFVRELEHLASGINPYSSVPDSLLSSLVACFLFLR